MQLDKYFKKIIENDVIEGGWLFLCSDGKKSFDWTLNLTSVITSPFFVYLITNAEALTEDLKQKYQIFEPSISSILEIQKMLYLSTENKKVVIVKTVEELSFEAQNALLKIVEEPPARTTFFFISQDENGVIPTLLSRLRIIKLPILPKDQFYQQRISAALKKSLNDKKILHFYLHDLFEEDNIEFLENLAVLLRDQLFNRFGVEEYKYTDIKGEVDSELLKKTLKALEGIKYANLNKRLQIENILLNLSKSESQ